MTLIDSVLQAVRQRPHQTEYEISQTLFGGEGYQQRVNGRCRYLVRTGQLIRSGKGGVGDPFTYTLARGHDA